MKKRILFIAAIFAFAAISCDKMKAPVNELDNAGELKINITVENVKAVRTGWASGDKLNIWFDTNPQTGVYEPDLILTYNGTTWTAGALRSGVQASLKASGGVLLAAYESNNDLSLYTPTDYSGGVWYTFPHRGNYTSGQYRTAYQTPYCVAIQGVSYTYSENTLTSNISGTWNHAVSCFKVLVKNDNAGLTLDADKYLLQVYGGESNYAYAASAFVINSNSGVTNAFYANGSGTYEGVSLGVQEADGIAFYYRQFNTDNEDITFKLWQNDDSGSLKSCVKTGKTITVSGDNCTAVAIKYSDFI